MHKEVILLETIAKSLVLHEDKVSVERTTDDMGVLLTLSVDPSDMGKIIGREGKISNAIRTILRSAGMKENARVNLKILEPENQNAIL